MSVDDLVGVVCGNRGLNENHRQKWSPRVCKPWFPNPWLRLPAEEGLKWGTKEVKRGKKDCEPFSPFSIQKHPEPQICPKFVPAIVFGGSSPGDWKLSKICKNLKNDTFGQILTNFWQISVPRTGTPKKNRCDKFCTNLGVGVLLNAVRGKRVRKKRRQRGGETEVKLRLKWGAGICSPDLTRTTVWKPPFTDPRGVQHVSRFSTMR